MKEWAEWFYSSKRWQECRDTYKSSVGGLCERCSKIGLVNPGEIVHHKTYITQRNINDANITLNWENLELLCRECHQAEHSGHKRRYAFDEDGHLIC